MVYSTMIFAGRKDGVTHDYFKSRYERHMLMIKEICGDAMPLRHTRWYPKHEGDKPALVVGKPEEMYYDVIVTMEFEDEAAYGRFVAALMEEEANAKVLADEAGFWDRNRMNLVVVGDVERTER